MAVEVDVLVSERGDVLDFDQLLQELGLAKPAGNLPAELSGASAWQLGGR